MSSMQREQSITFMNASIDASVTSLRVAGNRIDAIGCDPQPGDHIVHCRGDRLMPGLINAHDHLQLNGFPRQKYRDHYDNVRDWITDVIGHREHQPTLGTGPARARDERLLLGGMKNLLSGVTTVAHHDPCYALLKGPDFPTRVVTDYGWSHSLQIDGEESVQESYRATPPDQPWIIHAAEGIDEEARSEFGRLLALGCIGPNTLLVHGVALTRSQQEQLIAARAGLIWCPTSNMHLFGRTADVAGLIATGSVAIGSDSRLSGSQDLLAELRVAREVTGLDERTLGLLVTQAPARLLRLPDRGELRSGALADLILVPASRALSHLERAEIRLVMIDGRVRYADAHLADGLLTAPVVLSVDGEDKLLDPSVGALIARAGILAQDLAAPMTAGRAA
jgi:cytosine/adenosine deaminase-related metal-dependent hydrolase